MWESRDYLSKALEVEPRCGHALRLMRSIGDEQVAYDPLHDLGRQVSLPPALWLVLSVVGGMCGVCVVYVWCMCGVCVVYVWCMCGVSAVYVRCMCGVCVVYVRCMCGVCVVYV